MELLAIKDYYDFHPMNPMYLGGGFSPSNITSAKLGAIDFEPYPLGGGALSTIFSKYIVSNSSHLKKAFRLDSSIEASYLSYSGGGNFSYNTSSLFDSSSITLIIEASSEYGRVAMKTSRLTEGAHNLISTGKMREFEQAHGSRYVLMEPRGARVFVLITISSLFSDSYSQITASVSGSGGFGPLSASAQVAFQRELKEAYKLGILNIQVLATGGEGFSGLSDLVRSKVGEENGLEAIEIALSNFLRQFNVNNSRPIGFFTASMQDFGYKPAFEDLWTYNKERKLLDLVEKYREIEGVIDQINLIVQGVDPRRNLLNGNQLASLQSAKPLYKSYLNQLADIHESCLKVNPTEEPEHSCEVPEIDLPPVLPPLPAFPIASWRFKNHQTGVWLSAEWSWKVLNNEITPTESIYYDMTKVFFLLTSKYINRVDFCFEGNILNSWEYSEDTTEVAYAYNDIDFADQIVTFYRRDGRRDGKGKFYLCVRDLFGRSRKFELATAEWFVDTQGRLIIPQNKMKRIKNGKF